MEELALSQIKNYLKYLTNINNYSFALFGNHGNQTSNITLLNENILARHKYHIVNLLLTLAQVINPRSEDGKFRWSFFLAINLGRGNSTFCLILAVNGTNNYFC